MLLSPILINGDWRPARSVETFQAFDPSTGEPLPGLFPVSSLEDAEEAVAAAGEAAEILETIPPESLASFLDLFAERIIARTDDLVETAHLETALPGDARLRTAELPRTSNQLHQAAAAVRDRSWRQATIDSRLNIRSIRAPLGGPVVVFGPNNFPFAFNAAAGGDFAAALAAGNPVIAKSHPSHPGTTRLFAEIARDAVLDSGLPPATLQLIYHLKSEDGCRLVAHPRVGATAFTGSRAGGLKLKEAADRAGKLIFLEMSGANPLFLLPGAVRGRGGAIAAELFASCSLGAGQFCTKPGLVIVLDDVNGRAFVESARRLFSAPPSGFLLSDSVLDTVGRAVAEMSADGAEILAGGRPFPSPGYRFENSWLRVDGAVFLRNPGRLQREAFGTVSLAVLVRNDEEMLAVAASLEGMLSIGVFSADDGSDDRLYDQLGPILRPKAGRLLNDKMPTGLAVVPSMVHGGPFPAAGHPGFTSVGIPASLWRFTALRCYDNVRPDRLPLELRDSNPTGRMMRWIDGECTCGDVGGRCPGGDSAGSNRGFPQRIGQR